MAFWVQSCGEVDRLSGYLHVFCPSPGFSPDFSHQAHQYEARIMVGGGNSNISWNFHPQQIGEDEPNFDKQYIFQDGLCKPPTSCFESLSLRYVKEGLRSSAMGKLKVGEDEHHLIQSG